MYRLSETSATENEPGRGESYKESLRITMPPTKSVSVTHGIGPS